MAQKKVQKDKQRSTKHTYKTKDRVTRTQLKTGGELRCSGGVSFKLFGIPIFEYDGTVVCAKLDIYSFIFKQGDGS
jgi:hypothetical protein